MSPSFVPVEKFCKKHSSTFTLRGASVAAAAAGKQEFSHA